MLLSQLTDREFYKKTIHLMVPVMIQQVITVGINFLDNIMVGSFGETQIAAASLGNQFYSLFQFVCMGLGSGAIVMSSQLWGAKEHGKLKIVAAIALRLTALLSVVFSLVTILFPSIILGIYTNQQAVITAGIPYLRLVGCTFLFAGLSSSATYLLRSTGHVRIPLIGSVIAFFINLFFNWVFIFGKLGMPRMELVGAAVGTIIARTFEFLLIFGFFVFKDSHFAFRLRHFLLVDSNIMRQYMKYGFPVLVSDSLLGIGLSLNSVIIGHISDVMLAAVSIVASANRMLTIVNVGMSGAAGVVIGNSIGERETDRAFREGVAYCILSFGMGIVISFIILALRSPYLSLYAINDETLKVAYSLFWCLIIVSPFQLLSYVTSKGILRGGGDTRFMLFGDIFLLWLVSIPLGYMAGLVWHLSPFWIYFFIQLEYTTKGLVCLWRFLTKKWIKII